MTTPDRPEAPAGAFEEREDVLQRRGERQGDGAAGDRVIVGSAGLATLKQRLQQPRRRIGRMTLILTVRNAGALPGDADAALSRSTAT